MINKDNKLKKFNLLESLKNHTIPLLLACSLLITAYSFEYAFMPVVPSFEIQYSSITDNVLRIEGDLFKERNCQIDHVKAIGVQTDFTEKELELSFISKSDVYVNRSQGLQDWGPWEIVLEVKPNTEMVNLYSYHKCHVGWLSKTKLRTIYISRVKSQMELLE